MRLSRSSLLVFAAALIASLSIHLPMYTVLGVLAKALDSLKPAPQAPSTVEFEIGEQPLAMQEPKREPETAPKAHEQRVHGPKSKPEVKKPEPQHVAKPDKPEPKPELKVEPKPVPAMPVPDTSKPIENKLAVTQKSDDPNAPPPDNSRFVAEENRRVIEETIASVRSLTENDDNPSASAPKQNEDLGNANEDMPAELQNVEGEDKRLPDKREAKEKPVAPSQLGQGREQNEAVARAPERGGSPSQNEARREIAAGSEAVGGDDQMLVIQDGAGSIRIRRTLPGHGPGDAGGEAQKGARSAQAAREAGARAGTGTNLNMSWSQYEATFGSEKLEAQREAYLEQKRSKTRGGQREEDWRKFRAAVENFVDKVKPGNQTALNAAASPFAAYLAEVHRHIHREFALRFLRSLPLVGGAYADPSLVTRLEIVINNDGTLHQVGVVRTSGFTPFDYGAWNAVTKSAPFPEPPKRILSGDSRVYVRWDFYNNERQCGTFNAEPFIIPHPAGEPSPKPGPLHDRGTVPPDGKMGLRPRAKVPLESARLP